MITVELVYIGDGARDGVPEFHDVGAIMSTVPRVGDGVRIQLPPAGGTGRYVGTTFKVESVVWAVSNGAYRPTVFLKK